MKNLNKITLPGKTKLGFNGQGQIRLESFKDLTPRPQKGGTFQYYTFINLDAVDTDDLEYSNVTIRSNSGISTTEPIVDMSNSFSVNGFDVSHFPPIFGTDGKIRDGRTRIKAAKKNSERHIAVAVYEYDDTSPLNMTINGLQANLHPPATGTKMLDFIDAGIALVEQKQLSCNEESIKKFLSDVNIDNFFPHPSIQGKIVKGILKASTSGVSALYTPDQDHWKKSVKKNYGDDVLAISVDYSTYVYRLWAEDIAKSLRLGNGPVKVVLFTKNKKTSAQFVGSIKEFNKNMEMMYKMCFNAVNDSLQLNGGLQPQQNTKRPWVVLGIAPQVIVKHDQQRADGGLVSLNDF